MGVGEEHSLAKLWRNLSPFELTRVGFANGMSAETALMGMQPLGLQYAHEEIPDWLVHC